jgi:coenzyme F420-0:L-glutamate ligase/coenzyme F420-1:gamma-L-glutamate ligase
MVKSVSYFAVPGIPHIEAGDELAAVIVDAVKAAGLMLENGDIVVIAKKIVSKVEERYVYLKDVVPTETARALGAEFAMQLKACAPQTAGGTR